VSTSFFVKKEAKKLLFIWFVVVWSEGALG
jgi:hypothetical protein